MDTQMRIVTGQVARSVISNLMRPRANIESRLGTIELRDHQRNGVSRVMDALDYYGGALLCDEVGLGKTYTAIAVAKRAGSAVVIAPAVLTDMWRSSLTRASESSPVISLERFSRSEIRTCGASLVIIDEAHHLRNSRTARFHNVASFIGSAKVLLLSATPLHNHRGDVLSLLSLFLGGRAATLDPADESRCIIRRRRNSLTHGSMPVRIHCEAVTPPVSVQVRRLLLALPPPVPPRDGDDCGALVQFTLLRQWASSDAALTRGLQSRISRAHALVAALEAGTFPTRKELTSWITAEMDVQLGFAELLASPGGSSQLLAAVREHRCASEHLLHFLESTPSTDLWRANYLRNLRTLYRDRKIVAFTQFASTARELYRLIKADGKVGLVTSNRCEIASGTVSRQDVIHAFAPMATGCAEPPDREAITLLIATDLCSEGLNLQDAGVVIHLDLPWTPAKIEQRIGRIARTGSPHPEVFIHAFRVPDIAEDLLRLEQRLQTKRLLSDTVVGGSDDPSQPNSIADASERIRMLIDDWKRETLDEVNDLVVACIDSERPCWVAVIGDASRRELICDLENGISADPRQVLQCLGSLGFHDVRASPPDFSAIIARVDSWLEQRRLDTDLQVVDGPATTHRLLSRQIHQAASEVPVHQRPATALHADHARRALRGFHNIGLEAQMMELAKTSHVGNEWLKELAEIAEGDGYRKAEPDRSGFKLLALLVGQAVRRRSGAKSS